MLIHFRDTIQANDIIIVPNDNVKQYLNLQLYDSSQKNPFLPKITDLLSWFKSHTKDKNEKLNLCL